MTIKMNSKIKILMRILVIGIILIDGWWIWSPQIYAEAQEVTITTNKTEYGQGETIKITVRNALDKSIWYLKETCPSSCCNLFRWENNEWRNLGDPMPCRQVVPPPTGGLHFTQPDELKPEGSISKQWDMTVGGKVAESGKYRYSFFYGLSKDNFTEKIIYSNEFTIKDNSIALKLWMPTVEPDGIFPNTLVDVRFGVLVTGLTSSPDAIQLEEVDSNGNPIRVVGNLKDDGREGDLLPNDYIYSGVFPITSEKEGKLYYRATVKYGGRVCVSETCMVAVTDFPVGPASSNPNSLVTDSKTGQKLYSNELNVRFIDGVSPERIREIVSAEKASVVGTIPSIGVFQLRIPTDSTPEGVYKAVKAFQAYKEVEYAEPNYAVELDDE